MQKITPFLWFDDQAEEAARFYVSIFRNARLGEVTRYTDAASGASGRPKGSVMTVAFQIEGQDFTALNGGPVFQFSQAISFVVNCDTQTELDAIWDKLAAGGEIQECGWLKDKYGIAWQVVPAVLPQLMQAPKAEKVMARILQMKKLDIAELQRAAS